MFWSGIYTKFVLLCAVWCQAATAVTRRFNKWHKEEIQSCSEYKGTSCWSKKVRNRWMTVLTWINWLMQKSTKFTHGKHNHSTNKIKIPFSPLGKEMISYLASLYEAKMSWKRSCFSICLQYWTALRTSWSTSTRQLTWPTKIIYIHSEWWNSFSGKKGQCLCYQVARS